MAMQGPLQFPGLPRANEAAFAKLESQINKSQAPFLDLSSPSLGSVQETEEDLIRCVFCHEQKLPSAMTELSCRHRHCIACVRTLADSYINGQITYPNFCCKKFEPAKSSSPACPPLRNRHTLTSWRSAISPPTDCGTAPSRLARDGSDPRICSSRAQRSPAPSPVHTAMPTSVLDVAAAAILGLAQLMRVARRCSSWRVLRGGSNVAGAETSSTSMMRSRLKVTPVVVASMLFVRVRSRSAMAVGSIIVVAV
ncbi:hypothetical protein BJY00DRAFT_70345 [Aspergillus carlsbadensis]|nr:hypothetical protein BJY00DRAFT_70345 [Aspergillus carlsbadensis]